MALKDRQTTNEKTCIKGTGLSSFGDNSNVTAVDVKNGKIVRIRPLHFDWKYKPDHPPTGNKINIDVVDIFRFQDGKIAEHWDVVDTFTIFSQVGVIEQRIAKNE
jgi:hypothetical protein